MERLTFEGNFCEIALCLKTPGGSFCEDGTCSQRKVWERLKAYEDIGLTPERCAELAEADKDGRVVVLPCKVGDTVYEPNKRGFVSTYKVVSIHLSNCSMLVGWEVIDGVCSNVNGFEASALGKTVFLTREEAEAALREAKKDG